MKRHSLSLLAVLVLVLAACGGDAATTTTAGAETPATTAAAAATTTTTAAAATTTTAGEVVELLIWADEQRTPVVQEVAGAFTEATGVNVTVETKEFGDIRDQMVELGPAGEGADVFIGAHDWTGQLAVSGVAAPVPMILAPMLSTFASLCSRPSRAVTGSAASTQRIPRTLFATIASPVPLPPITIPHSKSPRATARATGAIRSG